MTRLTDDMIKDLPDSFDGINKMLIERVGMDIKELSCKAVGLNKNEVKFEDFKVSVVPITSGLGVISNFSESVSTVAKGLGMDSSVTKSTDVDGLAEAIDAGSDIVFMADDISFVALNLKVGKYSHNTFGTAAGYSTALEGAIGGLNGKEVLIIGAGRVGTAAVKFMHERGAKITLTDIDTERCKVVASEYDDVSVDMDIEHAISTHVYILNASPGQIPGRLLQEGTVISTPGIPHEFDEECMKKAIIIHDPLDIGTSVMAAESISFSCKKDKEV